MIWGWNARLEEWTGLARNEVVGFPLSKHLPKLTQPPYADRLTTIFQNGPPVVFSSQLHGDLIPAQRPDGTDLIQKITVSALPNGSGYDALFAIQDASELTRQVQSTRQLHRQTLELIHKRQQAEAATSHMGRILDEASNEIYIFDAETLHFIRANRGARMNLGYSLEELKQRRPIDLKPAFDLEAFEALLRPLRSGEQEKIHFETLHQRKDGSLYPVEVQISLVESETPPVFVAIIHDISERRRAEEALQAYTHSLERTNSFLTALGEVGIQLQQTLELEEILQRLRAEMLKIGFHYIIARLVPGEEALEIRYSSISPAVLAQLKKLGISVLGYRLTADNTMYYSRLIKERRPVFITPAETMAGVVRALPRFTHAAAQKALKMSAISETTASFALPLMAHGKVIGALIFWGNNLMESDIAVAQVFASQVAIALENARLHGQTNAALQRANQELQHSNQQLIRALEAKTAFLQRTTHELRTPLNAIIGFAGLLQRNSSEGLKQKQQRYVENIRMAGERLLALVNDMLDASALVTGEITLSVSPVRLGDAITSALSRVTAAAEARQIQLHSQIGNPDLTLMADPERLVQILNCLLENALKFTPKGGEVRVESAIIDTASAEALPAAARQQPLPVLLISIADTGIGIAPDAQDRIFHLFEQVETPLTRAQEGSGLGLTLARGLVELHGGHIWPQTQPGEGTTIFFTLPLQPKGENLIG